MNNRTILFPVLVLLGLCLTFTACKKDEPEEPAPTKTALLSGNTWVLIAYTVDPELDFDGNGTQEGNLIPFFDACDLDDFIDFKSDQTYTVEEGATKCDVNSPQVYENGAWTFNSDETRVVLSPVNSDSYEYKIVSISSGTLVVEQVVQVNGVTYTFTQTYN